jgi:ferrous iron transport protein A
MPTLLNAVFGISLIYEMEYNSPRVSLDTLPPGRSGRVVSIRGGRRLCLRLGRLGLRQGAMVRTVTHGAWRGPLLVEVNGAQVALGRGIARRIVLQLLP